MILVVTIVVIPIFIYCVQEKKSWKDEAEKRRLENRIKARAERKAKEGRTKLKKEKKEVLYFHSLELYNFYTEVSLRTETLIVLH